MNDTDLMQQLRDMRYPTSIDVVAPVMEQVRNKPLLVPTHRTVNFRRITSAVAACLLLAVGTNITLLYTHNYDESKISNMIAEVYNYNASYADMNEASFGLGAIESLY